ncbi:lambda exonuclease family protein [Cryobacterium sp. BB736]|uniref:lambda exonuclease family protein n=1 Tax=Cryobacterium sp. BB736 TaxID=2746963 RepID=UPI00187420D2
MSLQIIDVEQGSDEWVAARCGILTASQVGKLITPTLKVADNDTSRGVTETLVAERITGRVDYVHPSFDMQRGTLDEPLARDLYAEHYAPVREIGFAVREFNGYKLGASPDGLVGDAGGLEIKSRRPKTQLKTILVDKVPLEHIAQIQACLLVLDREWWDYCSYAGGWPLFVKRVYADQRWHAAILYALDAFEENAARMIDAYKTATHGAPVAPYIDHFEEIVI